MTRTLTEELQSVLIDRSLAAPRPADTIEAVLARTVHATESDPVADGPGGRLRRQRRQRREPTRPGPLFGRRHHDRPDRLSIVVAAAALVIVGAGVTAGVRHQLGAHHSAELKTATSALASVAASAAAGGAGDQPTSDGLGRSYAVGTPEPVVPGASSVRACAVASLVLSIPAGEADGSSVVIRATNVGAAACSLNGFPEVRVAATASTPAAATELNRWLRPALRPISGLGLTAPGTAVLTHGQSASAVMEAFDDDPASCELRSVIQARMPGGSTYRTFTRPIQTCNLQLHQFIADLATRTASSGSAGSR
jgi:hypothetical protein